MSVKAKARLMGAAAALAAHTTSERVRRRPAPTVLSDIPASARELTPEWLTAALCKEHPDAKVVGLTLGAGSDGSTSRRGITIGYNDVGRRAGLPTRIFTKSTPSLTSRLVTGPTGLLACESAFYNSVGPSLDIEVPRGYFAAFDPHSYRSMFLLEDVAVTRAAEFGDPTTMPVTRKMAESQVDLLAALHGGTWDSPMFVNPPSWLRNVQQMLKAIDAMASFRARAVGAGIERSRDLLPPQLIARREELWPAYLRSLELNAIAPMSLLHNDVHLGN